MGLNAQVLVNGKHVGEVFRSTKVSGEVEVCHIGGKCSVMPVNSAWINIIADSNSISIGAKTDQPVIDGLQRKNYFMPSVRGTFGELRGATIGGFLYDDPKGVKTFHQNSILGDGRNDILVSKTAKVFLEDKNPVFLYFTHVEYSSGKVRTISFTAEINPKKEDGK